MLLCANLLFITIGARAGYFIIETYVGVEVRNRVLPLTIIQDGVRLASSEYDRQGRLRTVGNRGSFRRRLGEKEKRVKSEKNDGRRGKREASCQERHKKPNNTQRKKLLWNITL